jgi:hypothetical protein
MTYKYPSVALLFQDDTKNMVDDSWLNHKLLFEDAFLKAMIRIK